MSWKLLEVFIFMVGVQNCLAINCYQCSGSDPSKPFQCNEALSSDIDLKPEPCDNVYDAQYCIKHVGRFEEGVGAKRFCSSLDLGNYCNYVQQPGDILTYRTCIYTCSGNGCNAGTIYTNSFILTVLTSIILLYRTLKVNLR